MVYEPVEVVSAVRYLDDFPLFLLSVGSTRSPEYGTVDADQLHEAAKEASKRAGADLLLMYAFAFDATAGETAKEFQPAEGSGWAMAAEERKCRNPPLGRRARPCGDPRRGGLRPDDRRDALEHDRRHRLLVHRHHYNEESFFVREAYFTGADEAAWATLCTTKSRPFSTPETGKIAVKVINHYGDEVMKVFSV